MTNLTRTIFKEVATAPWPYAPAQGLYRVRYFAGTDIHGAWKNSNAEEQVASMSRTNKAKYEHVEEATWNRARAGELNGWAKTSDAEAEVVVYGN